MEPCTALPVESAEGVKVEPLKRPIQPALYTESDLHVPPVHRRGRTAAGQRTLRAPQNRVAQYDALIRSTRTFARAAGRVHELVPPDRNPDV